MGYLRFHSWRRWTLAFSLGIGAVILAVGIYSPFFESVTEMASRTSPFPDPIASSSEEPSEQPPSHQIPQPSNGKGDKFAEDRLPSSPMPAKAKAIAFDGERALNYLKVLCALGPRISGTEGMRKQQELLQMHFEKLGGKVVFQRFTARQPSQKPPIEMANLIVRWHPDRKRRVILCGHYDTRPIADQEPRRADWFKPFLSANDGTSTVAWLMELAHHMKDIPTEVGVDFVLFDGEECIFQPSIERFFIGSEYFAEKYWKERPDYRYIAAILLDLFAAKDARIPIEQNSKFAAGALVQDIWQIAAELKCSMFRWEDGREVNDDHIALLRVGIPAIDLIDFDYPHWHRLSDTPDKCSAESMNQVAKVITVWLQRVR